MKKEPTLIHFVKIKSWYVPADAFSYRTLRDIGFPLLKVHADFLPHLQRVTRPRNIRAKAESFTDVLKKQLQNLHSQWTKNSERICTFTKSRLTFIASLTPKHKELIDKIDAHLAKFFARYGFRYNPTYSETTLKAKLVVDYNFDAKLNPVIQISTPDTVTSHEVELGFTKIKLTFHDKPKAAKERTPYPPYILLEVLSKTGDTWQTVHTAAFSDGQIGQLDTMLAGFGILHSRLKAKT